VSGCFIPCCHRRRPRLTQLGTSSCTLQVTLKGRLGSRGRSPPRQLLGGVDRSPGDYLGDANPRQPGPAGNMAPRQPGGDGLEDDRVSGYNAVPPEGGRTLDRFGPRPQALLEVSEGNNAHVSTRKGQFLKGAPGLTVPVPPSVLGDGLLEAHVGGQPGGS
jgi:hypothetical protein